MTQYNRISKIYVYLNFTFFFSFPSLSPTQYATSTSTSGASRKTSIFLNTNESFVNAAEQRRLLGHKIIVKYWHHLCGISTVVIRFLGHIFGTSSLELPSYPLASSQSMTENLEQSVFIGLIYKKFRPFLAERALLRGLTNICF